MALFQISTFSLNSIKNNNYEGFCVLSNIFQKFTL